MRLCPQSSTAGSTGGRRFVPRNCRIRRRRNPPLTIRRHPRSKNALRYDELLNNSGSHTPSVLSVTNLRKQYGGTVAVDGITFAVDRNEIVGLLGPNGAGKTTTINMILGVLEPDSGTIRIEDIDLAARRSQALQRTNFVAVYSPLPGNLTVVENLRFFGLIYGVGNLSERIDALIGQFDLERFRNAKCGVLSSGEQTRVGLAKALLNRPHLLLLDEPTASLDPSVAREVREKIREVTRQGTGRCRSDARSHEPRRPGECRTTTAHSLVRTRCSRVPYP